MGKFNVDSIQISDMTNSVEDVEIQLLDTDGLSLGVIGREWPNEDWTKWFGIYDSVPEVKIAFDMRAVWTIGNGYKADAESTVVLDHLSGYGVDTFDSILKNMFVVKRINGDSFAEIIRDKETKTLINLVPLNPGKMTTVFGKKGRIIGYKANQLTTKGGEDLFITLKPEDVFHLTNKRIADDVHGKSDINALQDIIKANKESFDDMRKLMHRFVKPMFKFTYDTDDDAEIDKQVTKFDNAVNKGENIHLPKGTVDQELISVPSNATLNPMPWRQHLTNYFFQTVGIPQIIMGSSGEFTESTAKIAYLAFEQSVKEEQRYIEQQIWNQLQIRVKFVFPASLKNELLSDEAKDVTNGATQPADLTAGVGR